ncbi:TolC family protein [Lamprocystis purpurea]|jgi:hypothetical protein|uniref:hypothetical protein n=1 Tax=Lamprocystis purpurea TaxID=61598 RepID=UPI00146E26FA|nr:hypothetical protein [Lamprocystis purpurea]
MTRRSLMPALTLCLALGTAAGAPPLPEPLSLEQALALADSHPRTQASPSVAARLPRRHPLYLDCHALAFGVVDPARGRPPAPLIEPVPAQRLEIMERFFDVLLADLAYSSASEAMAVAYVQLDRARAREELGQTSPLRVSELDAVYEDILQERTVGELGQQWTRALLAQALGRPETLPRDLVTPMLPPQPAAPPPLDTLAAAAVGEPAADTAADQQLERLELHHQLAEIRLRLLALAAAERKLRSEAAYRDLKLDESRTLYEQEVSADLGYAMSRQTMTRMQEARVGYCRALAWAELNALTGRPVWPAAGSTP